MIQHSAFTLDAWAIREEQLDLDILAQTESVFALANGHIGLRANLEEGEPAGLPGTYVNSVYELRPLPYAEAGYGYPESGQSMINVTNGKLIRLLVDDEPFDVRYGELRSHRRVLDLRAGTLDREVEWTSPAGRTVHLHTVRLVSFAQRSIAAIHYEIEPVDGPLRVVVQSELVANEPLAVSPRDPRVDAALSAPLVGEDHAGRDAYAVLVHQTAASGIRLAAAMDHLVDGPPDTEVSTTADPDVARVTVTTVLQPGQKLQLVKFLAYGWSSERSRQALRDQVAGAITGARHTGWDGLLEEQRSFLDDFWSRANVEVDGDPEIQQSVRFGLFHVLQAGARAERRAIPAKGLTGTGYDGHAFWDTETFVLPVLTYALPETAADALRWRHSTLPAARERARTLSLSGAAFPWRTITGDECSSYWPAGTAAFHVNADIADAVVRYIDATEDQDFERDTGLELLAETARLWRSLGHHDREGRFRIDGVTGPDEYSAIADNNIYTNLLARQNLRAAADAAERHPDEASGFGVDDAEIGSWRAAAAAMYIPYDEHLGVHPQAERFTNHQVWDFEGTRPDQYPLLLSFPYFELYRKQVVKQADLVLAMHLQSAAFTDEEKARNFAYYERLTVRDSSLSACTQAVIAAEVGHLDLAYDYLGEAALIDLDDLEHNTRDGVHIASLAGGWIALVAGFGGLRLLGGTLCFSPRLPAALTRLAFNLYYRKRRLSVTVQQSTVTYRLLEGEALGVCHHGELITLQPDEEVQRPVSTVPPRPRPTQPAGRAPVPRDPNPGAARSR
jgi:alpha,alpha-trehalose phosphorylase